MRLKAINKGNYIKNSIVCTNDFILTFVNYLLTAMNWFVLWLKVLNSCWSLYSFVDCSRSLQQILLTMQAGKTKAAILIYNSMNNGRLSAMLTTTLLKKLQNSYSRTSFCAHGH